jgi:hypothetical protein
MTGWRFRSSEDADVVTALRDPSRSAADVSALLARAERHGLAGALFDTFVERGIAIPPGIRREIELREIAREADHAAHLAMLRAIAGELGEVPAVALKGPLLGERVYRRPSARTSMDIDLLVAPDAMEAATTALTRVGYRAWDHPREEHFRRRGHHLHFLHDRAPPVELHFHAFRGFGGILPSAAMVARSRPTATGIRVPSPADDVAYLAIHAAGHRFMKLGWLYDLHLLLAGVSSADVEDAFRLADEAGLSRPMVLALDAVRATFGASLPASIRAHGTRYEIARTVAEEPRSAIARSATRFAYTISLCEDWTATKQYVRDTALGRIDELFRSAP